MNPVRLFATALRCVRLLSIALWSLACLGTASVHSSDLGADSSGSMLQLDISPVRLPSATLGKPYSRVLKATGGRPPYRYKVISGSLPEGVYLDEQGEIRGTPSAENTHTLTVRVQDSQQQQAYQDYSLRVLAPKVAAAEPKSATPKTVSQDVAQATSALPPLPQVEVYKLEAATLQRLVPTPSAAEQALQIQAAYKQREEDRANGVPVEDLALVASATAPPADGSPPAPGPLLSAQIKQLIQLLTPLLDVEYPSLQLFEAALDAQLCQLTLELVRVSAIKQGGQSPSPQEFAKACPVTDWERRLSESKARRARALASSAPSAVGDILAAPGVSWQELAPTIMPPELRAWLLERSRTYRPLSFNRNIAWDGKGCGCVQDEIESQIYGFFPAWWSGDQPRKIDFSRLHRISVVGLAIDDNGSLALPEQAEPGFANFAQQAHVHGTKLDLTIYRNDWKFLGSGNANQRNILIERMVRDVPVRALDLIDKSLDDWGSRFYGLLPGLRRANRLGDGITLYLDNLPSIDDRPAREQFDAFYKKMVEALIVTLRKGPNHYTLNLVISDREIANPGAFALDKLLDYLRQAEEPTLLQGRIRSDTAKYQSNTNLTLRFIVTLSEPTGDSKKALRVKIDQSTDVRGGDRRIFLEKVIPLISPRSKGGQQFADDLVYFNHNFGGVAFWPLPIQELSTPTDFGKNFDTAFISSAVSAPELAVRGWVCEHRGPLHAAFVLLLLIGAACWLAMTVNCDWRTRWGRTALLGAPFPVFVGGLLFVFDPSFKSLRESVVLFATLLFLSTLWAVFAMRRIPVEKP